MSDKALTLAWEQEARLSGSSGLSVALRDIVLGNLRLRPRLHSSQPVICCGLSSSPSDK